MAALDRKFSPMESRNQPLQLSQTFRHFNSLMWQIPSWGIAIATGVFLAADHIGKSADGHWIISVNWVQALVLFFGSFLLVALACALYRFRAYQAASAPIPVQRPPFGQPPRADSWLQGAVCLTAGRLICASLMQAFSRPWLLLIGLLVGAFGWRVAELSHAMVVQGIERQRSSGEATSSSSLS